MLHGELIHGAYALDSVLTELLFVAGPALTAAIAVAFSPGAALLASAAAVTIGTFSFLAALVYGRRPPTPRGRRRGCSARCVRPACGRWS